MNSTIFTLILTSVLTTTVLPSQAAAQIYSTDFSTLDGWTVTTDCWPGYEWAADATPALWEGATPYVSPPASLNFNNGVHYGGGGNDKYTIPARTCGTVTSPAIDLSASPRVPVLRFMVGGLVEPGCLWDRVSLRVRSVTNGTLYLEDNCVEMSPHWSLRQFELDSSWGLVEIEFFFDTLDNWINDYAGPFIDDLEIIDRCSVDPSSPCDEYLDFCFGDGSGTPCPCGNNSNLEERRGCNNSSGDGARLIPSGIPRVAHDSMRFQLDGAPLASFAFLLSADNALPLTDPGAGNQDRDGLRCIGGNLLRHGARATDLTGRSGFGTPGWGAPDNPSGGLLGQYGFVHGQTRYFQVFVRDDLDSVCGTGLNRSNGVKVLIQ